MITSNFLRENILKTARMLVEDTKALVASSSQQQQLQTAAKQAASTVNKLADFVKDGAASLGANNSDSQVNSLFSFIGSFIVNFVYSRFKL